MGIKQLMKLIVDEAPAAVKEHQLANYNGRIIAIDASMAIYQFLVGDDSPSDPRVLPLTVLTLVGPVNVCWWCVVQIAVRSGSDGRAATMLTNEAGEVTR